MNQNQTPAPPTANETSPHQRTPCRPPQHFNTPALRSPPPAPAPPPLHLTMKLSLIILALISVVVAAPAPQETFTESAAAVTTGGPDSLDFMGGGSQHQRAYRLAPPLTSLCRTHTDAQPSPGDRT